MQTPSKTKFQEVTLFNSENGKWPEFLVLILSFLYWNSTFALAYTVKPSEIRFLRGTQKEMAYRKFCRPIFEFE